MTEPTESMSPQRLNKFRNIKGNVGDGAAGEGHDADFNERDVILANESNKYQPASAVLPSGNLEFANHGIQLKLGSNQQVNNEKQRWLGMKSTELRWRNLSVREGNSDCVLTDVHGQLRAGSFTAILGPHGNSSSVLLKCLSGQLDASRMRVSASEISLDGYALSELSSEVTRIGYVEEDVNENVMGEHSREQKLFNHFTFIESLEFGLMMRQANLSELNRRQFIDELLEVLSVKRSVQSKLVKELSRAEKKILGIAVELLVKPSLLCLMNPLAHMSPSESRYVISGIKGLAAKGISILGCFVDPSSETFFAFDEIFVLSAQGQAMFQGSPSESVGYFEQITKSECLITMNPYDYFAKVLWISDDRNQEQIKEDNRVMGSLRIEHDSRMRARMPGIPGIQAENNLPIPEFVDSVNRNDSSESVGNVRSMVYIFLRGLVGMIRNEKQFMKKLFFTIAFIVFYSIVFANLGAGLQGIQQRNGALFFMAAYSAFTAFVGSSNSFWRDFSVYVRENSRGMYKAVAYFLGKTGSEVLVECVFFPVLFTSSTYYLIGLSTKSTSLFVKANLACILTAWHASSFALLLASLIGSDKHKRVRRALLPLALFVLILLSGNLVSLERVPIYWRIISIISAFRFGYEALCNNEFHGMMFYDDAGQDLHALDMHGFPNSFKTNCVILLIVGIIFRVLALIALHYTQPLYAKQKQKIDRVVL